MAESVRADTQLSVARLSVAGAKRLDGRRRPGGLRQIGLRQIGLLSAYAAVANLGCSGAGALMVVFLVRVAGLAPAPRPWSAATRRRTGQVLAGLAAHTVGVPA